MIDGVVVHLRKLVMDLLERVPQVFCQRMGRESAGLPNSELRIFAGDERKEYKEKLGRNASCSVLVGQRLEHVKAGSKLSGHAATDTLYCMSRLLAVKVFLDLSP